MEFIFVYMTAADVDEAKKIARALVASRLAACVNIIHPMQSVYEWEGKIQEDSEVVMIAKTTREKAGALEEKVKSLHSYTCPCIAALPVVGGHEPFLSWIEKQVR